MHDERLAKKLDSETELAIVIGKPGRFIPVEHALEHVFGYTIVNDVSARCVQLPQMQFYKGKSYRTFGPTGPVLLLLEPDLGAFIVIAAIAMGVLFLGGVQLISLGILVIAWYAGGRHTPAAAGWALGNALIIAVYTLVDGAGARASGNAASYVCWLIFLEGMPYLAWIGATRGRPAFTYIASRWRRGIAGGAASLAAYGIALWAMTRAPVAVVAALREVSVLFAAGIGALVLKEGFGWRRMAGAAAVVAGVAALRL